MQDKVSSRYARAILNSTKDKGEAKKVVEELRTFADTMANHKDLAFALTIEMFATEKKAEVVKDVAEKLKLSTIATRSLVTISDSKRMKLLNAIIDKLNLLLLASEGVVPLNVRAATELAAEEKKNLEGRFAKILGKAVDANYEVDPALIGGVRVTAGGRTYDGSLSGWLNAFEESLVGGNV